MKEIDDITREYITGVRPEESQEPELDISQRELELLKETFIEEVKSNLGCEVELTSECNDCLSHFTQDVGDFSDLINKLKQFANPVKIYLYNIETYRYENNGVDNIGLNILMNYERRKNG